MTYDSDFYTDAEFVLKRHVYWTARLQKSGGFLIYKNAVIKQNPLAEIQAGFA